MLVAHMPSAHSLAAHTPGADPGADPCAYPCASGITFEGHSLVNGRGVVVSGGYAVWKLQRGV